MRISNFPVIIILSFMCVLLSAVPAQAQDCTELEALLCERCGDDHPACFAGCEGPEGPFCGIDLDDETCREKVQELQKAGDPAEICHQAPQVVIDAYPHPNDDELFCPLADAAICHRCGPVDDGGCGGVATELATLFGSNCGMIFIAGWDPGRLGLGDQFCTSVEEALQTKD